MAERLKRNLGPVEHLQPGEYTVETRDEEPVLRCPKCGGVSDLELGVHVGGMVAELWSCPYACSFQSYLVLDDWGEPVVRAPA